MRVAIVHYWLVEIAGGERVLESLVRLFPRADVYTNVHAPARLHGPLAGRPVRTTAVQRLPLAERLRTFYLPLMPLALGRLDLSAYDLVVSSESGPAKGARVGPRTWQVCYCHSPMRYVWDMEDEYAARLAPPLRPAMRLAARALRAWDRRTAAELDVVVANSTHTRERVRRYWGRDAEVVPPPVDVARFGAADDAARAAGAARGGFVCAGRLVGYKRVDLAVEACTRLGLPLTVVGRGPEEARLRRLAGPTVRFVPEASDADVARHLAAARALLFPGEEDFGIVPVEAMAAGTPVVAYARGGALDTVADGETGVLFHEQTADALAAALAAFAAREPAFDPARVRAHAARFDRAAFERRFAAAVGRATAHPPRAAARLAPAAAVTPAAPGRAG